MPGRKIELEDDFDADDDQDGFLAYLEAGDGDDEGGAEPDDEAPLRDDDDGDDDEAEYDDIRGRVNDDEEDEEDQDEEDEAPPPRKKKPTARSGGRKQKLAVEDDDEKPIEEVLPWLKKLKDRTDAFEPEVIESITELGKEVVGVRKALKKRDAEEQARRDRETLSLFDAAIGKAGAEDVLGEGPTQSLAEGSKERKARDRLLRAMNRAAIGYQATGETLPDFDELFSEAYLATFGRNIETKAKKQAAKEIREKVEKRAKSVMHVPSGKTKARAGGRDAMETPKQRALAHIKRFVR